MISRHDFPTTPNPQNVPLDQKPILLTAHYPENAHCSEGLLFQKYTFSDYWGLLRFWNNVQSEQWGVPDLESESSEHKICLLDKKPKAQGLAFQLLPIKSLYRLKNK